MIGLAVYGGATLSTLKLIVIIFFLLISSATCGHAIGRSALKRDIQPWRKEEEGREDGRGA